MIAEGSAELTVLAPHSAQETKKLIEEAGQKALLLPGDLMKDETRKMIVDKHLEAFKFIGERVCSSFDSPLD